MLLIHVNSVPNLVKYTNSSHINTLSRHNHAHSCQDIDVIQGSTNITATINFTKLINIEEIESTSCNSFNLYK